MASDKLHYENNDYNVDLGVKEKLGMCLAEVWIASHYTSHCKNYDL